MKKNIVISAVNIRSGGTLTILNDCLQYLDKNLSGKYNVIALVCDRSLLESTCNITYFEFSKSSGSYFYRIYYEYYYFNKISKLINPFLWFSLHDMTPKVKSEVQAVYCHNATPFYKIKKKDFFIDLKFSLFVLFYKYIYKINIKKNNFVVVQQEWLRNNFIEMYKVENCIVSHPNIKNDKIGFIAPAEKNKNKILFFYPSLSRSFKNFEVIFEAVKQLNKKRIAGFKVVVTIDGQENKYAKLIYEKYSDVKNIEFIGLQPRGRVYELYSESDCLIFPSKLETWGLPISEFKEFNKPIILADLPYAHETLGEYNQAKFFDPEKPDELSSYMEALICNRLAFVPHDQSTPSDPFARDWQELFDILLVGENIN